MKNNKCIWNPIENKNYAYNTKCKNTHAFKLFDHDTPKDNKFKFCPYCGKKIYVEKKKLKGK